MLLTAVKKDLEGKIYPSGKYEIFASDVNTEMVEIAKRNAERAGVGEDITFSVSDYLTVPSLRGTP
jgi:23S rRNA G2445 N2-methylase RlmL